MTKKPKSIAWHFFDKVEENGKCNKVLCNLCCKEYKFIGNTTNMRSHLSKKHPIQWGLVNAETINESLLTTKVPKAKKRKISTNSIIDQDEDTNATINLIRQMHDETNEEWIEETEVIADDYQPENNIKRVSQFKEKVSPQLLGLKYHNYNRGYDKNSTQIRDEYSTFGEYIASKFKNMPNCSNATMMWLAEQGRYDQQKSVNKTLSYILFENDNSQDFPRDILVPCTDVIDNINILQNNSPEEDTNETVTLVRQINDEGEEEWLEEPDPIDDNYEPPTQRRAKLKTVKREVVTPPHRISTYNIPSNTYKPKVTQKKEDEWSIFGEYIANKLRKLSNIRTRSNVQQLISTLLWQAEQGQYHDQENVKNLLVYMFQRESAVVVENDQSRETIS